MDHLNIHPLIQAYIEQNKFGRLIGASFFVIKQGVVEYSLLVREKHLATPNAMHGGCIAALLDATIGVGALSLVCEKDMVVSTLELKVTFLNACGLGEKLTCTSVPIKAGNRLIFMEAELRNEPGMLLAKASATLNVYPKEKAGYI